MHHRVRQLTVGDVPAVLEIQEAAYEPHLLETGEVFASKILDVPGYCLGAEDTDGSLVAYVIAFPMSETASVGLHETGARVAAGEAPILYIHDTAVFPHVHGTGIAGALVGALESVGRTNGQTVIELVAIESAISYWERHGFVVTDGDVYSGYGPGARKMHRTL